MDDLLLLTPGPVRLHPAVREAMAEPMVSHRSAAFEAIYERARDRLETVFERSSRDCSSTASGGTTLLLNGTATMAMEAAVSNLVGPDDEVVALVNGKFGRRFARLAARYARSNRVEAAWGQPVDLAEIRAAVSDETAAVTMVHNETSTGLLNPVEAVGEIAASHDARFIVDGVTSIGGDAFRVDDWHVDVAVVGSQKALGAPPGLSAVYVTDAAIGDLDGSGGPFYHDLEAHRRKASARQTPYTSAVPLFRALAVAVEQLLSEGLPARIDRHRRFGAAFRTGFEALGLDLFAEPCRPSTYSNTVTAVALPAAARDDPAAFFDAVMDRGVAIAGGQGHLHGEIFRVSNMGALSPEDVVRGIRAVGEGLVAVGATPSVQAGVDAASDRL